MHGDELDVPGLLALVQEGTAPGPRARGQNAVPS